MLFIKKVIKNIAGALGRRNPELIVRIRYRLRFHKRINLDNPQNLNEKIQYLSLRTDTTEWSRLSDKFTVRDYVKERGLESILNRLYGVWSSADEIDFDSLPDEFVVKTTHGSGDCIIVKDKGRTDVDALKRIINETLSYNYGEAEGNLHYSRIKPRVIVEELIHNDPISEKYSTSLIDYKIWCFNGMAYYVWVCTDRTSHGTKVLTYDKDWKAHPEYSVFTKHYMRSEPVPKPENLDAMFEIAEKLAEPFPLVRVDLYNIAGTIYFGEMTFTSLGGYMNYFTQEFLMHAGQMVNIIKVC